jgi:hypothetical protein
MMKRKFFESSGSLTGPPTVTPTENVMVNVKNTFENFVIPYKMCKFTDENKYE